MEKLKTETELTFVVSYSPLLVVSLNVSNVTSQAKIIHTRKLGPNESIVRIPSITPLIVKRLKDNPAKDRPQGNAMLLIDPTLTQNSNFGL